jgi:hypothetical protein
MADYARVRTFIEYSENSDYGNAVTHSITETESPTQCIIQARILVPETAVTVGVGNITTLTKVIIKNNDTSSYVTLTFDTLATAGSVSMQLGAGEAVSLADVDYSVAITLTGENTSDDTTIDCEYSLFGT